MAAVATATLLNIFGSKQLLGCRSTFQKKAFLVLTRQPALYKS